MTSLIHDLSNPAVLPDKTQNVSVVQTHISTVFVADAFVYKVKKAVNFGFLDFSTLEKRAHYCRQEVALNKRLSEDVYLGVLPITYDGKIHRLGGGQGEVVDYAVKMRRLPEEKLMKSMFEKGKLKSEDLHNIARVIAEFHQKALRSPEIEKYGEPEAFKINTDENFEQTTKYINATIEKEDFDLLRQWTNHFFDQNKALFYQRIEDGKVRDCHGDLHMEHICLLDPIAIIDCIEFNDRFRYMDMLGDIAFLLMDLEFREAKELSEGLWQVYAELTGSGDMEALLNFYKVYRAYVRGKVMSFQLDDEMIEPREKEIAAQIARNYFKLACGYIK
ncbi:phosphotransferase [Thermodesulfobacteriota bacterium]